jgi:hypothetical protein
MRALYVSPGFAGAKNDKTICKYDAYIQKVKTDPMFTEMTFELYKEDGNGSIVKETEKGAYLIVDGGYHEVGLFERWLVMYFFNREVDISRLN